MWLKRNNACAHVRLCRTCTRVVSSTCVFMCLKTINQLSPEAWHFKCMHFSSDIDRRLACRPQLPAGWDILKHRVTRLLALLDSEHGFISRTVSLPRCINHTKRCYIFLMHRSWSTPAPKQTNQKKGRKQTGQRFTHKNFYWTQRQYYEQLLIFLRLHSKA